MTIEYTPEAPMPWKVRNKILENREWTILAKIGQSTYSWVTDCAAPHAPENMMKIKRARHIIGFPPVDIADFRPDNEPPSQKSVYFLGNS